MFSNIKYNFKGKIVLIIGGSKGIGAGLVKEFLKSGAKVYYVGRTRNRSINNAFFLKCDLKDLKDLKDLEKKLSKIIKIDILINSAAINFPKPNDKITFDEWKEVFAINMDSIFFISKIVLKIMKKNNSGSIVNISSIAGRHRSVVSGIHYVSSKSALIGYTKQLSYEYAKYNIRVNVVCPSQTYTDMLRKTMNKKSILKLSKNIPLKRIAKLEEQIGPIMFLCSDSASYITGAVLDVNGGQI